MRTIKMANVVCSWCEEKSTLLKIKLYFWGELLILSRNVEEGLTRYRCSCDFHLDCEIDIMSRL